MTSRPDGYWFNMPAMNTLTVELGTRSYPINIGKGLLADTDLLAPHIHGKSAVVVTNTTVAPLYLKQLQDHLTQVGVQHKAIILPDGEEYKTLDTLNQVYTRGPLRS
jgi:3-dehydroquinate synthase